MPLALPLALALLSFDDPRPPQPPAPIDVVSALETVMSDAISNAGPSVVAIARIRSGDDDETTAVKGRNGPLMEEPVGLVRPRIPGVIDTDEIVLPGDFGSGVVIGDKGEILTVYHIVKGASKLVVRAQGQPQFEAEILAADPRTDLAVIAPREGPNTTAPKLRPLKIGDAGKLRQGAFLVALGNPFNAAGKDGRASASWGILSNVARRFEPPLEDQRSVAGQFRFQPTLLQLDAKLNLGMSGGAVITFKGELIGITTAAGNPSGFDAQAGYAIPMDALGRRAVESLRQGKEVEYAFLGIGLDLNTPNKISKVSANTPAAEGKLVQGDTIVEVGGIRVEGEAGLSLTLATAPVGQPVNLKVLRNGEIVETTVNTSKYPTAGQAIATNRPSPWRGIRVDFASVLPGTTFSDQVLEAMAKGGVGVVDVETGSPADAAGLKKGQIITTVAGRRVKNPAEFAKAVAGIKGEALLEADTRPVTIK